MIDYQQGKIYKIECNVTGKVYIGSTCEPILARRLAGHITNYRCYLNGKSRYLTSYEILQNRNYDIVLIESYPCNSKDELHSRERYYTNNINCVNKVKAQGMTNELGEKEYKKQYRENNKDMIQAKKNEKHMCICGNCYTYVNKQRHIRTAKHQQYLYYIKHKTIIDGLNMIKALDKYFNSI
jgi:DNA mismatch repair ATPase MutS